MSAPSGLAPLLLSLLAQQGGSEPAPGHTLHAAVTGTDTYLVDREGAVVHSWPGSHPTNLAVYLLPDGSIMRNWSTGVPAAPGATGAFEQVAFDGTPVWEYRYDGPDGLAHHDFEVLPNGNILFIAWELRTAQEAIDAGRDPATLLSPDFWPLEIVEVEKTGPATGQVVWRWRLWDHMVQDFDPAKPNYGDPALQPHRVDLNYPPTPMSDGDWAHANGIDYNPQLDQIVVSVLFFNEIWIIDHSTTTAEAAGSTGGNSGRGGDLLYRWGNPEAYRAGGAADKTIFGSHDPNWIEPGLPGAGDILFFNNGRERPGGEYSSVEQITPPLDPQGNYAMGANGRWGPAAPNWSYSDPPAFYSRIMSGAQRLANGNTLITEAADRRIFEVDPAGTVVWEYVNPYPAAAPSLVFLARRVEHYLWQDVHSVSASAGGVVEFDLVAGTQRGHKPYRLLGSMSGTAPGVPMPGGLTLPLNPDPLFARLRTQPAGPQAGGFVGLLDNGGAARAVLDLSDGLPPGLVGTTLYFAFAAGAPPDLASNAVAVEVLP